MTNDRGETQMMTMLIAKLKNQAECNEFMKLGASLLEDGYFSKRTWADPPPLITNAYETLKKLKYRMWKDDTELNELLMYISDLSIVTPFNYLLKPELIQIDFLQAAANANIDKHPIDKKAMGPTGSRVSVSDNTLSKYKGPTTWKPSTKNGGSSSSIVENEANEEKKRAATRVLNQALKKERYAPDDGKWKKPFTNIELHRMGLDEMLDSDLLAMLTRQGGNTDLLPNVGTDAYHAVLVDRLLQLHVADGELTYTNETALHEWLNRTNSQAQTGGFGIGRLIPAPKRSSPKRSSPKRTFLNHLQ